MGLDISWAIDTLGMGFYSCFNIIVDSTYKTEGSILPLAYKFMNYSTVLGSFVERRLKVAVLKILKALEVVSPSNSEFQRLCSLN